MGIVYSIAYFIYELSISDLSPVTILKRAFNQTSMYVKINF